MIEEDEGGEPRWKNERVQTELVLRLSVPTCEECRLFRGKHTHTERDDTKADERECVKERVQ